VIGIRRAAPEYFLCRTHQCVILEQMEYQVPQFTEVEDKIFGPFTLKQFIYLAGGAGLCAVVFLTLPFILALFFAIPIAALAGALAFYRVNGKSFVDMLEAGFTYYTGHRLYLWKKEEGKTVEAAPIEAAPIIREKLALTQGKLQQLAWSLDIQKPGGEEDLS